MTAAVVALCLAVLPASAYGRAISSAPAPSLATFEGGQIDLSQTWGDAQACLVYRGVGVVECFRTRTALLEREARLETLAPSTTATLAPSTASVTCSSPLRLFADSNYGGRELDFYDRGYWQNLSAWSFDNQLSSYKVGSCGVYLADGAAGAGSWYPGNTSAGHYESVMASGWNDRISSIFIQ
jgi:hypothetical protein